MWVWGIGTRADGCVFVNHIARIAKAEEGDDDGGKM